MKGVEGRREKGLREVKENGEKIKGGGGIRRVRKVSERAKPFGEAL